MGPWLRSHGRIQRQGGAVVETDRFNGAVASQPRKAEGSHCHPAPRAASMGPWLRSHGRGQDLRHRIIYCRRFNGAVASQPRKVVAGCAHAVDVRASMGPWLRSHGRLPRRSRCLYFILASMGPWLRSHGRRAGGGVRSGDPWLQWGRGFAATEGGQRSPAGSPPWTLQWGRGFAATEGTMTATKRLSLGCCFNGAVASQPRKARWRLSVLSSRSGFNGAVASQPRKERHRNPSRCNTAASMGPWLRSHGRRTGARAKKFDPGLQWGRGFAATEGKLPPPPPPPTAGFNGAVASQPRKGRRGWRRCGRSTGFNGAVASQPRKASWFRPRPPSQTASMGPWLRSHGRRGDDGVATRALWLQWGRGFAATEGPTEPW